MIGQKKQQGRKKTLGQLRQSSAPARFKIWVKRQWKKRRQKKTNSKALEGATQLNSEKRGTPHRFCTNVDLQQTNIKAISEDKNEKNGEKKKSCQHHNLGSPSQKE